MSKRKSTRKEKQQAAAAKKYANKPTPAPVKSRSKKTAAATSSLPSRELTFGAEFYKWIGGGFGLVLLGMILMAGGEMPSPDIWDEDIIYSFRRITLAPIVIMGGIGVVIYAIFKK